jgi:hypothetical protein
MGESPDGASVAMKLNSGINSLDHGGGVDRLQHSHRIAALRQRASRGAVSSAS